MSKDFIQSNPVKIPEETILSRVKPGNRKINWSIHIFFLILTLALLKIYYPSFTNPPRSDYWSTLYTFNQVDSGSGQGLGVIFNYDPFRHGTFRPLFYVFLYLEHSLFGDWFTGNHLVSFLAYLGCVYLLYLTAYKILKANKLICAAFCGLFAGLFSHFDIITWTFHVSSLIGLACFLGGGLLLNRTGLNKPGWGTLLGSSSLFLAGMFCYEVFAAWPLVLPIIFLWGTGPDKKKKLRGLLIGGSMTICLYLLYFLVFLLSRQASTYMGRLETPSALAFLVSAAGAFFNLIYNSLCLNLVPIISVPAMVKDNVNLGGLLYNWNNTLLAKISWIGGASFLISLAGLFLLVRRGRKSTAAKLSILLFLYFSYFFIVMSARLTTNFLIYPFIQFRYQFVPNALFILGAIVAVSELLKPRRREKIIICLALIPIMLGNLYLSSTYSSLIKNQLKPLEITLNNIRLGIEQGSINPGQKVYIDPGITEKLPLLCWNRTMAYLGMVKGTYRWIFRGKRLDCLAPRPESATWIVPANSPDRIIPARRPQSQPNKEGKI